MLKTLGQPLRDVLWFFFAGGLLGDLREVRRYKRDGGAEVLFFYKSGMDEQWLGSTVDACPPSMRHAVVINRMKAQPQQQSGEGQYLISQYSLWLLHTQVVVTTATHLAWFSRPRGLRQLVHMPHSLASLHMIYPEHTFDAFDVIFAAGEHHVAEVAAMDQLAGRRERYTPLVGYGKMDILRKQFAAFQEDPLNVNKEFTEILLAPSWGKGNLLETDLSSLVAPLLALGFRVTVRPHPRQVEEPSLAVLTSKFSEDPLFQIEDPATSLQALFRADLMISDYSGVAFEFAFLRERPLIFLDVPKKVLNPHWQVLSLEPIEIALREKVGRVLDPKEMQEVANAAAEMIEDTANWAAAIQALRPTYVAHFEKCATYAVRELQRLLQ